MEDTPLGDGKRWVRVAPPGDNGPALLLARAAAAEQESRIGNQTGGRVFLFLHTDDFWRDYQEMKSRGVRFTEEPRRADWLHSHVVKEHAEKETFRKKRMTSDERWAARAGWHLTAGRVARAPKDSTSKRCSIASRRRWLPPYPKCNGQ